MRSFRLALSRNVVPSNPQDYSLINFPLLLAMKIYFPKRISLLRQPSQGKERFKEELKKASTK